MQQHAVDTVEAVGVTNDTVLSGPDYADKYGSFQDAVIQQVETGNVDYLPGGQDSNEIITVTGQALSSVLAGQESAEDALSEAAESLADAKQG